MSEQQASAVDLLRAARAYELLDVGPDSPYKGLVADIGEQVAEFAEGSRGFSIFFPNNPRAFQLALETIGCETLGDAGPVIYGWCNHGGTTHIFGSDSMKAVSDVPLGIAVQMLPSADASAGNHMLNSTVEVGFRARPTRIESGQMIRDGAIVKLVYWHVLDPLAHFANEDWELYDGHFGEGSNRQESISSTRLSMMAEYNAEEFTPYQNFEIAIFREDQQTFYGYGPIPGIHTVGTDGLARLKFNENFRLEPISSDIPETRFGK